MGARFHHEAPAFCAVLLCSLWFTSTVRAEPPRNCPKLANQSVIISKTEPTAFQLNVTDLGRGTISIFQFPLGGILEQPGPTPLDFIFVPNPDFGGTTTFTYRLTPPDGCARGLQMGKVTLAGGVSDGTDYGLNEPPKPQPHNWLLDLCGAGLPLLLPLTLMGLVVTKRRIRK